MLSSRRSSTLAALLFVLALAPRASAQQAEGYLVERFYPSAPGAGWFVMDALDTHGGLGGAVALTTGYALNPLRVGSGPGEIRLVSDQAFASVGMAATYDRFRFWVNITKPLVIDGQSGAFGGYAYAGPAVDLGSRPDTLSDTGLGFDARIYGDPRGPFRLGAGAQLFVPNGQASDYDTDSRVRGMLRVLVAGDVHWFTYAAQLGVHIRPRDDSPTPGGLMGSELLFGAAVGARIPIAHAPLDVIVGPELWGETAFLSFFRGGATAFEGLMTGRIESTGDEGVQFRVKLGLGGGLVPEFGAPEWRMVAGIEMFGSQPKPKRP